MEAKAVVNYVLISPRKIRLVADEIRGYGVNEALSVLRNIPKKGARLLEKAVFSARSNFIKMNPEVDEFKIYIKKLYIDQGPTLKRIRPRARGRAFRRLKRMSKITVVISDE